jgi:hypothetical protein
MSAGANCRYFERMLKLMGESMVGDFSCEFFRTRWVDQLEDTNGFNVMVYQTFPDEKKVFKFKPHLIEKADKKFLEFNGLKILFDSHDWPEENGYERFGMQYPRIKHIPGVKYKEKFDVILAIPHDLSGRKQHEPPLEVKRNVMIHCAFSIGCYPHKIREDILDILKAEYSDKTSFQRVSIHRYERFLRSVKITVTADGFGPSAANVQTLHAGTLLFVHEHAIHNIQILPHTNLVDGEDYVSFNFENFRDKLNWLISDSDAVDRIRLSGQRKFFDGFDYQKSANQFYDYLRGRILCYQMI